MLGGSRFKSETCRTVCRVMVSHITLMGRSYCAMPFARKRREEKRREMELPCFYPQEISGCRISSSVT